MFNTIVSFACICYVSVCIWRIKYYYYYYYTNPRDVDASITGSGFGSLGDASFYRGSVNTGDRDTALIFASDGQLQLLRSCRLVYVDATFRTVSSLFYQLYLRSSSSTPITRYNKLNAAREVHHLAFHTCIFPRF